MEDHAYDFTASPSKRQKVSDSSDRAEAPFAAASPSGEAAKEASNNDISTIAAPPVLLSSTYGLKEKNEARAPDPPFTIPGLGGYAAVRDELVNSALEPQNGTRYSSPSTVKSEGFGGEDAVMKEAPNDAKSLAEPGIEAPTRVEAHTSDVNGHVSDESKLHEEPMSVEEDTRVQGVQEESERLLDEHDMTLPDGLEVVVAQKPDDEAVEFKFEEDDDVASQSSIGRRVNIESDSSQSGDSDSDASSSSGDELDSEDEYSLLDPMEQARRLMAGESDDSGAGATKAVRTKNEKVEEVVPKPDLIITPEMEIQPLGLVQTIVENVVLIQAKISGIDQALDVGSVLCLGDRKVVGVIADIFGKTEEPYYTLQFTTEQDIKTEGISLATEIFFVPQHASYIMTRSLRNLRGTDASKDNDEPGANDEVEFSDDEKEREHNARKRAMKRQNGATERGGPATGMTRGNRPPRGGGFARSRGQWRGRGGHMAHDLPKLESFAESNPVLKYEDDGPSDEIYRRLTRPGTAQSPVNGDAGMSIPEQNGSYSPTNQNGDGHRGGRGSNHRGRGRGGNHNSGYQGPQSPGHYSEKTTQPMPFTNTGYPMAPQNLAGFQYPYQMPQAQYANNNPYQYGNQNNAYQPQFTQQFPYQNSGQPQYPNFAQQPGQPPGFNLPQQQYGSNNGMPFIPPGSHINPEFFRRQSQGPTGP